MTEEEKRQRWDALIHALAGEKPAGWGENLHPISAANVGSGNDHAKVDRTLLPKGKRGIIGERAMSDVIFSIGPGAKPSSDMTWQAFIVRGVREISRREMEKVGLERAASGAGLDLEETLNVWLAFNMPVKAWRARPEIDRHRDFVHDRYLVQIYARGWFDIPVRLGDHRSWMVELP